jgi:hypothetical protein
MNEVKIHGASSTSIFRDVWQVLHPWQVLFLHVTNVVITLVIKQQRSGTSEKRLAFQDYSHTSPFSRLGHRDFLSFIVVQR